MDMKKVIEKLLDGNITAYQIAKAIGVQPVVIQRYINGERKIGNMTLDRAEQLYKLYLELKEKGEIEND
ncbi:helix-turn-helix domain-containing protein [Aerococcaceae bacterium zg-ZUI334]|uniref:helix-turn-helix domain-containing protein n=1 Tax=Aerococcaceae bacterium zg-252 TaxID=2796928 RepID=UPI001B9A3592|nr:helix-turn-helix domain-containing protein [Aerococcaceae bacterium zg-ZUI334]